jgi:iron complex transport system ATP-binding protein
VEEVFGLRCRVEPDPVSGTPMVVPIGRHLDVGGEAQEPHPVPASPPATRPGELP